VNIELEDEKKPKGVKTGLEGIAQRLFLAESRKYLTHVGKPDRCPPVGKDSLLTAEASYSSTGRIKEKSSTRKGRAHRLKGGKKKKGGRNLLPSSPGTLPFCLAQGGERKRGNHVEVHMDFTPSFPEFRTEMRMVVSEHRSDEREEKRVARAGP